MRNPCPKCPMKTLFKRDVKTRMDKSIDTNRIGLGHIGHGDHRGAKMWAFARVARLWGVSMKRVRNMHATIRENA